MKVLVTGVSGESDEILSEQRESIRGRGRVLSEMRDMVYEGREYLLKGLLDDFGRLLNKGWELKKSLASGITNPGIEEIYGRAIEAGTLGGKVCGVGGRKAQRYGQGMSYCAE